MAKFLLLTNDDFGMCHAVNAGITRAMVDGIATCTNLMAPCPWFFEAVRLTKRFSLPVGVHLCLTNDWNHLRWGPLTRAPSLCDEHGYFHPTYRDLSQRALDHEVLQELDAQIERVLAAGIQPTHLDSHMLGSRMNDPFTTRVKAVIAALCRKYGLIYNYEIDERGELRHFTAESEISGRSEREIWAKLEGWTADGVYHLFGHAAEASPELEHLASIDHPSFLWTSAYRVKDLAWFLSPHTRERIRELGFQPIGMQEFLELQPKNQRAGG